MRWLDLFCGAGLVADGLIAAGGTVTGADIRPQPDYPGQFEQIDCMAIFALSDPSAQFQFYDAIWASPPCLRDTDMRHAPGAKGATHPELIEPTRLWLKATGLPYVIENVPKAPLHRPTMLWGPMFNLGVDVDGVRYHLKRQRIFETNWPLPTPPVGVLGKPVVTILGSHARVRSRLAGGRGTADFVGVEGGHRKVMGRAMGVADNRKVTCKGISDGIPPVYAEWIARRLRDHLRTTASPHPSSEGIDSLSIHEGEGVSCQRCRGTGRTQSGNAQIVCPTCNGWRVDFSTPTEEESLLFSATGRAAVDTSSPNDPPREASEPNPTRPTS